MEETSTSEASRQMGGVGDPADKKQRQKVKKQVCDEVLRKLMAQGHPFTRQPRHAEELLAHFMRLPTRYAVDVNTERAEDVLTHMRLLDEAKKVTPAGPPVIYVRAVRLAANPPQALGGVGMETDEFQHHLPPVQESQLALPAFGSTQNLEVPVPHQGGGEAPMEEDIQSGSSAASGIRGIASTSSLSSLHLHEITFSTADRPKLLSQLSAFLADVGLNIREAHVFSSNDGLSLDVFVVDGWPEQDSVQLQGVLFKQLQAGALDLQQGSSRLEPPSPAGTGGVDPLGTLPGGSTGLGAPTQSSGSVPIPTDGKDDWEIDSTQLKLHHKIASGSFGDLFRGTYCGQDVAIKILKPERLSDSLQQEFAQEVFIMRKVRHKNVVQFIGACTKPPNLSIVTEFMSGGSVFDYLHKHKGSMKPPMLVRVALDVAKGMDFLHKNHIIHRDLKAANLLMDENEVVKVADFGVARVQASSGIMTAETGTYRWMAPEVIEHRAYDHKADVFSYGITLWELLTGKIPYSDLTPLQAAVSVVQKGLRPPIPKGTHPKLAELMERCWHVDPAMRPEFSEIVQTLSDLVHEVEEESRQDTKKKEKRGGFFASLGKR